MKLLQNSSFLFLPYTFAINKAAPQEPNARPQSGPLFVASNYIK